MIDSKQYMLYPCQETRAIQQPPTDMINKEHVYTCTVEYYLAIKKEKISNQES